MNQQISTLHSSTYQNKYLRCNNTTERDAAEHDATVQQSTTLQSTRQQSTTQLISIKTEHNAADMMQQISTLHSSML